MNPNLLQAMNKERADEIFGPVVHKDDKFVVRVKRASDALHVKTHHVVNGTEVLPLAYILGHNALDCNPAKK